ncbi:MAG: efflux RND transporter periplasmic adaptor subunit [Candidatus Methylomirabilis sp.]|nr:efflux RND transporter periplasmic adaptor subunit [Deltaproteobacteria bacterium]
MKMSRTALLLALAAALALGCPAGRGDPISDVATDAEPIIPTLQTDKGHGVHGGHEAQEDPSTAEASAPAGYSVVRVSSERQQLIGLTLARVERAELTGSVRASAILAADETKESHIHTKLMGWVEDIYVNAVGQQVRIGDPLYGLYSQELFATQQEYLRAIKSNPELAKIARRRLELWDVPAGEIQRIERSGPLKAVTFRSPVRGTVLEKAVLQGHFIEAGMMLYHLADLSQVWALADVYEFEVGRLDREGEARVSVQGIPEPYSAKIDYVYPTVEPTTRTVRVRLVLPNADGRLRPAAFATVELPTKPAVALWLPSDTVIDTGIRTVAYAALGEGRFRPVELKLGRRAEGRVEVLEGLDEGAEVVAGAQFLIDSESRLRGAAGSGPKHGGH